MKKILIFVLALTLTGTMAVSASALDLDAPNSLTLHYGRSADVFPDLDVQAYRVAELAPDGSCAFTGQFADYPVQIQGITDQSQWQEAAQTLVAYIQADGLIPTAWTVTDESGNAVFSQLKSGLYLIPGTYVETGTESFHFQPFFIFLPTPGEDGVYHHDVQANPKPGEVTPHTRYTVVKLWKDDGTRPGAILVDILLDGVIMETAALSPDNDWSYTWTAQNTGGMWTVVERDVPDGYTVTITSRENIFTIVNTADQVPEETPDTGDRAPLEVYILMAGLSGIFLMILGIWYKRKWA